MPDAAAPPKTFPVSWDQLHRDAKALAWRLMEDGPWRGIVAITRGGLVPAAIVARELEIRLIDTFCVVSYDDRQIGDVQVLKDVEGDGKGWLIIDDLIDTGQTAKVVREHLPEAHLATVYAKPAGRAAGRYLHHRGEPGYLDFISLGYRVAVGAAPGPRESGTLGHRLINRGSSSRTRLSSKPMAWQGKSVIRDPSRRHSDIGHGDTWIPDRVRDDGCMGM